MTRIGFVGAGAGTAAAAYALRGTDAEVTVLEKSGGVCGRAATRRRGDSKYVYDYGANYVKSDDERVNALLTEDLDTAGLVDVTEPVWTFDSEGAISEGDGRDEHKWSYESGLTQIAKRLFGRTDATVHRNTRVELVRRNSDRTWSLVGDDGDEYGRFDRLVMNPPAPQTAELLRSAEWDRDLRTDLAATARSVSYRSIVTAVLNYDRTLRRSWYALVNVDKEHDVGWVAREECKHGHVPEGESLLVVQMSPDWSSDHFETDPDDACSSIADATADLLDEPHLTDPDWTDHQGWRYALPEGGADPEPIERAREYGLYFTGDWVAGEARLHAALRNGLETGEHIADTL
ncbi:MAG: NAD(P)/FAD-dependent oxidoreductase [Haloglomus sp.]